MQLKFKTLIELVRYFKDEKTCYSFLEQQIWYNGEPACPHCGSLHVYTCKTRSKNPAKEGVNSYKCAEKGCNKRFTATVGTIFEGSKLPLQTWFAAIWLCTTTSKGVSSANLAKQLGITQKTAWFVLSRIREMLNESAPEMLTGEVQVDETYVGGRSENWHAAKRKAMREAGTGYIHKTPVLGLYQNGGKVKTIMLQDGRSVSGEHIKPHLFANIDANAMVITDGFGAYNNIDKNFKQHVVINHAKGEYVNGRFHTNSIEGFWSQLKRGIVGVYHFTSKKHLHRYCNEYGYRYNYRNLDSNAKFAHAIAATSNARITYTELVK